MLAIGGNTGLCINPTDEGPRVRIHFAPGESLRTFRPGQREIAVETGAPAVAITSTLVGENWAVHAASGEEDFRIGVSGAAAGLSSFKRSSIPKPG